MFFFLFRQLLDLLLHCMIQLKQSQSKLYI